MWPLRIIIRLFFIIMFPLKLMRILDYAQPKTDLRPPQTIKGSGESASEVDVDTPPTERRNSDNRRTNDRREKQASTFLNTRKRQGRRVSHGRRASDLTGQLAYKPISLKG
jgi:hypothetical protein